MLSNFLFLFLLATGLILWLQKLRGWTRTGIPFLKNRMRIQSPFGLPDLALLFVSWFFSQMVATAYTCVVLQVFPSDLLSLGPQHERFFLGAAATAQIAFTFFAIGLIGFRYGFTYRIFGWQPEHIREDILIGIGGFLMIAPIIFGIQMVLTQFIDYEHQTLSMLDDSPTIATLLVTWWMAVIVAPITEELFFRGALQAWLQRQTFDFSQTAPEPVFGGFTSYPVENKPTKPTKSYVPRKVLSDHPYSKQLSWVPILITSLMFAMVHWGQGPAPIPLFVFSVALGYVYRQTGSILPVIVMHFLLNALSLAVYTSELFYPTEETVEPTGEVVSFVMQQVTIWL